MNYRERLRAAVDSEPVPRDLDARVRTRIEGSGARGLWPKLALGLAALVMAFGGLNVYTGEMLRVGLRDHVHCAVAGQYPLQTSEAEMRAALGPKLSGMLQPVAASVPGWQLVSAHHCEVEGRRYAHFVFRRGSGLMSLVLTPRHGYERLAGLRRRREGEFSIAGFTSGGYLAYIVSSMPESENTRMAEKIEPLVHTA